MRENAQSLIRLFPRSRAMRHLGVILCIVPALLLQSVHARVVGVVTVSDGESHLIRGSGYFEIEKGIDIEENDVIQTEDTSTVQVEMNDGSILEIGPTSEFYISEYQLRDDQSVEVASVSLVKGWLRFVTAKLRRSSRYQIHTSVATIGIRGTEGVVSADADTTSLLLNEGEVAFTEVNQAGERGAAGLVKPGEFIQRDRGKRFAKHRMASASFLETMPGRFKTRPKRYKSTLLRRGVKPKFVRAASRKDVERILRSNPRVGKKLKATFGGGARDIDQKRGGEPSSKKKQSPQKRGAAKHKRKSSGSKK